MASWAEALRWEPLRRTAFTRRQSICLPVGRGLQARRCEVTATSVADTSKSANASVSIASDIGIAIAASTLSVELGASEGLNASITSSGHPDTAVRWSVFGAACPSACGAIDSSGNYTAPQILPTAPAVTVTAQSVADPSKQSSTTLTITSNFSLQLSAPASIGIGNSTVITATFTEVPGSNPNEVLSWAVSGSGCSGSTCGLLSVVTTQSAGGTPSMESATYTAPVSAPSPNTVLITVTPHADASKKQQASLAVVRGNGVTLLPTTATLAANHRITLTAQAPENINGGVNWSVNGVPGGNASVGQICVVGTSPCVVVSNQPNALVGGFQVDYVAPGAIPTPNPLAITATSASDATKSAAAQITIINHIVVSVLPGSATLAPLTVQSFSASVLGAANQSVIWQVQGTGCAGGACGTMDSNGVYTAPGIAPVPDALQVVAISSDDTSQSGNASVTITNGINIQTLHPASVYAGSADGFTLSVFGSGFAVSSPGPGSQLLVAGTPRTTTCNTALQCTAPITAADIAAVRNIAVQLRSPSGALSNAVALVVAAPNTSDDAISLSASVPNAVGKDIVVVEPTTAGVSVPIDDLDLNVAALGTFSSANNSCTLAGNPISLQRPVIGTATASICLFSESGLDTSMNYTVSGPGDVTVIAKQPAGLGIVQLTLQIPATATPGARTLFVQNTNLDKAAASGSLEVN